jgi:hypothetical protein
VEREIIMKNIFLLIILICFFRNLTFSQYEVRVQIDASDNVNYIVINPFGQRTGVDSRYTQEQKDWKWYEEMPNSNYGFQSEGNLNPEGPVHVSMELMFGFNSPQADGDYVIEVFGWKTGLFNLFGHFNQAGYLSSGCNFKLKGIPIEKDSTVTFKVSYHGDKNASFSKIVDATTLIRDVSAMQKVGWIQNQTVAQDYISLYTATNTQIQSNNISGARATLNNILTKLHSDSASIISGDACKLLSADTRQLLAQLPLPPPSLNVKLINSSGTKLTGGSLQYYEGSWKDAVNNNDGTFFVNTTAKTISLRMTYEYGTQTKSNVTVGPDTVAFQTVNAAVQLQNSQGTLIDQGTVQYYSGAWRDFGTTTNGVANKELLPNSYSFRMTYAFASKDKQQDIGTNATVVFQTVNAAVQLQKSQGTLIDQGTVQYYSGAWRDLGITTNGVANKELLANNYSFRMTYEYVSLDRQQDLSTNSTVSFSTVLCTIRVSNAQSQPVDGALASYYSGAWRQIGTTVNGEVTKELLPANLTFRVTYSTTQQDKTQNLSTSNVVEFTMGP